MSIRHLSAIHFNLNFPVRSSVYKWHSTTKPLVYRISQCYIYSNNKQYGWLIKLLHFALLPCTDKNDILQEINP